MKQFKILNKTFNDPGVSREIVVNVESEVICRFIYDNEDEKAVRRFWIKIEEDKSLK